MHFTHFKCAVQGVVVHSEGCASIRTINFRPFLSPQEKRHALADTHANPQT